MPVHLHPEIKTHEAHEFCRRYPRIPFTVPITVRYLCEGGVRASRGISLDLGEGGLGALVQGEVQVGETVAIDLQLSHELLTTVAIVRHASSVCSGFEFVGLTPEERMRIANVIGHT
jgi:PilZ domain